MSQSLPPRYFEDLYAHDPDPWRFASSEYEQDKYADTLAALPAASAADGPAFDSGFEVGCSIGVFTQRLAARCRSLLAVDVAEDALAQARARCAGLDHVRFARLQIPQEWPAGKFDLILLSEVLYYLSPPDLAAAARLAGTAIAPGGTILLVHYTPGTNYPLSGDAAAEQFIQAIGLPVNLQLRRDRYRLDRLQG
jgi:SAM-dependent methyltransferase